MNAITDLTSGRDFLNEKINLSYNPDGDFRVKVEVHGGKIWCENNDIEPNSLSVCQLASMFRTQDISLIWSRRRGNKEKTAYIGRLMVKPDSQNKGIGTNTTSINLRANGGNTGVALSIGANTTGIFTDNTYTYTAAATDAMNYQIVTGSTVTSISISFSEVYGNATPAANDIFVTYIIRRTSLHAYKHPSHIL